MPVLDIYNAFAALSRSPTVGEILKTNAVSSKYGLALSPGDASALIASRNLTLHKYGRIELSIDAVKNIISEFCSSPYIEAQEYAATLNELVDIFYYMKNETGNIISDTYLVNIMKDFFNNSCQGSTDLLKNRELSFLVKILKDSGQI